LGGFSWICTGEFEFCSQEGLVQGAPVCWRFWARGPGYPYGILELGSCPSWQGGNSVWAELVCGFKLGKAAAGRSTRQASGRLASDQGILIYVFVLCNLRNMKCYKVVCKLLCLAQ
jgi:hypothetical protein